LTHNLFKKNACSSIYVGAFKAFDNKWAHKSNISELQHEASRDPPRGREIARDI